MQRQKQGIGDLSAEFLRVSYNKDGATGYLPRCVASTVSGNWVNTRKLADNEYALSMMQNAWTYENRAGVAGCARVFAQALVYRLGLSWGEAIAACLGEASVEGSPLRGVVGSYISLRSSCNGVRIGHRKRKNSSNQKLPSYATVKYMETDREAHALRMVGFSMPRLAKLMLDTSYDNTRERTYTTPNMQRDDTQTVLGYYNYRHNVADRLRDNEGVLMRLVESSLTMQQRTLLYDVMGTWVNENRDRARSSVWSCNGCMTFSDAMSLAREGVPGQRYEATFPVNV
jgi:hypothetical protein